jgi:hypothetical protein
LGHCDLRFIWNLSFEIWDLKTSFWQTAIKNKARIRKKLPHAIFDGFVKSLKTAFSVIPAKAGIQYFQMVLDACLRRHDGVSDFLRVCHI